MIKQINETLWHQERAKGIGGSEITAILGLDPYKTPLDVFLDKTGQSEPFKGNEHTRAGKKLEAVVVDYFVEETGAEIIAGDDGIIQQQLLSKPYILGTVDRIFKLNDSFGVLECKTTQKTIDEDELPKNWFCQVQWYMGIFGLKTGAIAWLERGLNFNVVYVSFDEELFKYMVNEAEKFWLNHVQTGIAPEPISGSDIEKLFNRSTEGKTTEANEETALVVSELAEVNEHIKTLEDKAESLKEQLKLVLQDSERLSYLGNTLITWKSSKASTIFDVETFKKEQPELYSKYLKERAGSRRFLLK
jgi:putative phage-type endonuclease